MKKRTFLKIAIACSNAVTMADIAGIAPAMGEITKAYSHENPILFNSIMTIPVISMAIFGLIAGRLCAFFSKKTVLLWGLFLFTVGGVAPILDDNIYYVLLMRVICGVGAGFVLPTYGSLIADFFEGDEKAQVMGLSATAAALLMIVIALVGGFLTVINWHYIYLTFLVGVILMVMAFFGIPKTSAERKSAAATSSLAVQRAPIGLPLISLAITAFLLFVVHPVVTIKAAVFFMEEGIGDAAFTGVTGAIMIAGIVLSGMLFKKIYVLLRNYTLGFGTLLFAVTYFVFFSSHSKLTSIIAMFVYGLAVTLVFPYLLVSATEIAVRKKSSQTLIVAVVTSAAYLGQFCSVFYISLISAITGSSLSRSLFYVSGFVLSAMFLILLAMAALKGKNAPALPEGEMPAF
jgi:predicted MFS family arabinose efflux permease